VTDEELIVLHGESELDDEYRITVLTASRDQWDELHEQKPYPNVTCPCGRKIVVTKAYRCLHCGIFWCRPCAKRHFGGGN
jgi:hypothetical protein